MELKSRYWRARYARWTRRPPQLPTPGYTVLLPVPGDLPVFLRLALAVCRAQTGRHRVATYVIPDQPSDAVTHLVAEAAADWPGELRELRIGQPEATLLPRLGDAGRNHGVQIITGVERTRSTHVVLHDADLFLLHPDVHDRQYAVAVDRDLDAVGVDPPWDRWYADHGRHLAATWELLGRTDWFRAFPPWRVIAHHDDLWGERHMFDTTFWAQANTAPERVAVAPVEEIVHFNYVISAYRAFAHHGPAFDDDRFRILLIRMICDLFGGGDAPDLLPSFAALAAGLDAPTTSPCRYDLTTPEKYVDLRAKAEQILQGPWPAEGIAAARAGLAPFDARFGWTGEDGRPSLGSVLAARAADRDTADVTVVIPVHDRSDLLADTLASVAAQTVLPAEVIVVDDGSSDGSGEVARAAGATVIRHDVPVGPGAARNAAVAAASTTWVAFVDSDDLWAPDHLAGLLRSATPEAVLVSAPAYATDGSFLGNPSGHDRRLTLDSLLVPGEGIVLSGTMARRDAVLAAGGFPATFRVEDAGMWLRLLRGGAGGVETGAATVLYRLHEGAQLSDADDSMRGELAAMVEAEAAAWLTPRNRTRHGSRAVWDAARAEGGRGPLLRAGLWYARHPVAVPALTALLTHRRRTRRARAGLSGSSVSSISLARTGERPTVAAGVRHPAG